MRDYFLIATSLICWVGFFLLAGTGVYLAYFANVNRDLFPLAFGAALIGFAAVVTACLYCSNAFGEAGPKE